MRKRAMVFAVLLAVVVAGLPQLPAEARHIYDMYFPISGDGYSYWKSFGACRDNCRRKHKGIDIMAPKLTPVVAVADGTIRYTGEGDECCAVSIRHDDGWHTVYAHLNNDVPGTDNGKLTGYAPGIELGVHVTAGTLLGWVGDSGNSEHTRPHLHFELRRPRGEKGVPIDPHPSLRRAELLDLPLERTTAVCDFNNDGSDEWVVGDPGADTVESIDVGQVVIHYASESASVNGVAAGWFGEGTVLTGSAELDLFGASLACGDFNGDGYDDLAVGAPGADLDRARHAGQVSIFAGAPDGLILTEMSVLLPEGAHNDRFGATLGAADMDSDGLTDLVVGAPYTGTRWSRNGGAIVVYRATLGGLRNPELIINPQASSRWHLIRFGTSIQVEDRNGDSIPDIVVGAAGTEAGDPGGAAFYVFPASPSAQLPSTFD